MGHSVEYLKVRGAKGAGSPQDRFLVVCFSFVATLRWNLDRPLFPLLLCVNGREKPGHIFATFSDLFPCSDLNFQFSIPSISAALLYFLLPSLPIPLPTSVSSTSKKGLQKHTKERMAIKAIRLDNPSSFYHEVKMNTLAQGSGSIVTFRESFVVEGVGYLVHDLCCYGEVFHHIIPHTGLNQRELIGPFFAQLIDALAFLHAHGVCHLDVKPEVRECEREREGEREREREAIIIRYCLSPISSHPSFCPVPSQNMFIDRPGHMRLGDFGLSALAEDGPVHGCRGSLR